MVTTVKSKLHTKYPWLFLSTPLAIDLIYDLSDEEITDEREKTAGADTIKTAKELARALEVTGNHVNLVSVTPNTYRQTIIQLTGDIVFNQVEECDLGYQVLKLLEELSKKYTGVNSIGYKLSWDKVKTKEPLTAFNIPTPKYFVANLESDIDITQFTFPLFVKAADDHGSLSINKNSVVNNVDELKSQIQRIHDTIGGDSLIEEYIDGREIGVTILGNGKNRVILPPKEMVFGKFFTHKPKIITYNAKWNRRTLEYSNTINYCPIELSKIELHNITEAVNKACDALSIQDYARFDIRLRQDIPYVIDYNSNPALSKDSEASVRPAKVFGLNYPQFISSIVAVALARATKINSCKI